MTGVGKQDADYRRGDWRGCGVGRDVGYFPGLSNLALWGDGNVLYLCCAVWQPLALCGYDVSNVFEKLNV